MRAKESALTIMFLAFSPIAFSGPPSSAVSGDVNTGVFTSAQGSRGQVAYAKVCASCHMPELTGSDRAPALAGNSFLQHWRGSTLEDLFRRIKTTMPQTNPQSLTDATYADIVAFLLQSNGFPDGEVALTAESGTLSKISITDLK